MDEFFKPDDSLQMRMRKLDGYNTRGSYKPRYFLLHKDDVEFIRDLLAEDLEWQKKTFGIEVLRFNGIMIVESDLAKKGEPLVVMGAPK